MTELKTFTEWLRISDNNGPYFLDEEITPSKLAFEMLQSGKLNMYHYLKSVRMVLQNEPDEVILQFLLDNKKIKT